MNKFITVSLVCVVLGAIALVMLFHGENPSETAARPVVTTPVAGGPITPQTTGADALVAEGGSSDKTPTADQIEKSQPESANATDSEKTTAPAKSTEIKMASSAVHVPKDSASNAAGKQPQQRVTTPDQRDEELPPSAQIEAHGQGNGTSARSMRGDQGAAAKTASGQTSALSVGKESGKTPSLGAKTPTAQNMSEQAKTPAASESVKVQEAPQVVMTVTKGSGTIKDLSLHFSGNAMYLTVEGNSPLPLKFFTLPSPDRLVIDLPGTWKGLKPPVLPSNQLVKSARIGRFKDADRIVLDLSRPLKSSQSKRYSQEKVEIHFE